MTKWNGLNRNNKPRQISKKKMSKLPQEKIERDKVKIRANGHCEICGEFGATPPTYKMETHEIIYRSALGRVSEQNSVSCDSTCHEIIQRYRLDNKPQCLRMIIQARNVDLNKANEIYQRIYGFAEQHGLIRESKLKQCK